MKKKIILLIGVIVISSFSIGYITSILISNSMPNEDAPKFYIAIDDSWLTDEDGLPNYYHERIRPDSNELIVWGGMDGTASPSYSVMYIRFDLRDKPRTWEKVEISLYEYNFNKRGSYVVGFRVDLFEGNWNETSGNTEVYWKIEKISHSLGYSIGFKRFDITNYIKNNDTISMRIYVRKTTTQWRGSLFFYSSEWDGLVPDFPYILPENDSYKNYLPQLIYS